MFAVYRVIGSRNLFCCSKMKDLSQTFLLLLFSFYLYICLSLCVSLFLSLSLSIGVFLYFFTVLLAIKECQHALFSLFSLHIYLSIPFYVLSLFFIKYVCQLGMICAGLVSLLYSYFICLLLHHSVRTYYSHIIPLNILRTFSFLITFRVLYCKFLCSWFVFLL